MVAAVYSDIVGAAIITQLGNMATDQRSGAAAPIPSSPCHGVTGADLEYERTPALAMVGTNRSAKARSCASGFRGRSR